MHTNGSRSSSIVLLPLVRLILLSVSASGYPGTIGTKAYSRHNGVSIVALLCMTGLPVSQLVSANAYACVDVHHHLGAESASDFHCASDRVESFYVATSIYCPAFLRFRREDPAALWLCDI